MCDVQTTVIVDAVAKAVPGPARVQVTGDNAVRCDVGGDELRPRPGGTISGPCLFELMESVAAALLGALDMRRRQPALDSVSTTIVEAAPLGPVCVEAEVVRNGLVSCVVQASITAGGSIVTLATLRYSWPPARQD